MWREFEYLSPERAFHTKGTGSYEFAFWLLVTHPNRFYYTPMGLFVTECAFYVMYLSVFTFFIWD
eukprot:CAMPEP_0202701422 /NCGR_PEP_ID=MMETSP1385-20130828/14516_1 /ASSEMBLY_ACC=CAM_ASM_000861 /TAXON_ID=933848 /ORGANISM="Elphidium margaritaceum" /LENGTH=64 /DNA_ID=CAMNT_0049358843 /DNA_START=28 /DNA_END=219 /DNA_ORIENTATION=+